MVTLGLAWKLHCCLWASKPGLGPWGQSPCPDPLPPVSPQESSDSTHTTIEDEDTKGSNLPRLRGWWAGHWQVGSWDSKGLVLGDEG